LSTPNANDCTLSRIASVPASISHDQEILSPDNTTGQDRINGT
jgi:hypothetical protein